MAILVSSGRVALAIALKTQSFHCAWGTGDVAWDTDPVQESTGATALVAELGRARAVVLEFAYPDVDGYITFPSGKFSVSATPTDHLYLKFQFGHQDEPLARIREIGVFVGSVPAPGTTVGQNYFTPDQISYAGRLMLLERFPFIDRSLAVRQSFEFVIQL